MSRLHITLLSTTLLSYPVEVIMDGQIDDKARGKTLEAHQRFFLTFMTWRLQTREILLRCHIRKLWHLVAVTNQF